MRLFVALFLFFGIVADSKTVSADQQQFPNPKKTRYGVYLDVHHPEDRTDTSKYTCFVLLSDSFKLDAENEKLELNVFSMEKIFQGVTYDTDLPFKPGKLTVLLNQYHDVRVREYAPDGEIYVTIYRKGFGPKDRFTVVKPRTRVNQPDTAK